MALGRLFIVATPIGNLEDITARALRVLSEVDYVAAEDTRHSKRLLDHFGIGTPLISYHDHNEAQRTQDLLAKLLDGNNIALITDAGTPCVSDPGYRLVRAAHENSIPVVCVPGVSAATAALSVSGLPNTNVSFRGFLPRKPGQLARLLEGLRGGDVTTVFFESPNRLSASLVAIADALPEAEVCVARELTKLHEQVVSGAATEMAGRFKGVSVKGECVVLVHAPADTPESADYTDEQLRELVERAMADEGISQRDAIRKVAESTGLARNAVYGAAVKKAT